MLPVPTTVGVKRDYVKRDGEQPSRVTGHESGISPWRQAGEEDTSAWKLSLDRVTRKGERT